MNRLSDFMEKVKFNVGRIEGVVSDSNGIAIVDAFIWLEAGDTVSASTMSNDNGNYTTINLTVG